MTFPKKKSLTATQIQSQTQVRQTTIQQVEKE